MGSGLSADLERVSESFGSYQGAILALSLQESIRTIVSSYPQGRTHATVVPIRKYSILDVSKV